MSELRAEDCTARALLPPSSRSHAARRSQAARRTLAPSLAGRTLARRSLPAPARCCWLLLAAPAPTSKEICCSVLQFQFQSPLAPSPAVLLLGFFSCLLRFTYCCCLLLPVICSWLPADSDFSDSIVAV
jgi:hypothetical protein